MPSPDSPRLRFFDAVVLVLSVYVLVALVAEILVPMPEAALKMLQSMDWIVCAVFMTDFVVRFRRAESKMAFMRWGWIDLLSSIPVGGYLALGRAVRIVQIVRILRAFRSTRAVIAHLHKHRFERMVGTTVLIAAILLLFCTLAVLVFENEANSNIRTPMDALWWGMTTITTVGYGDRYPVTTEGRIVAMILMVAGVSLFGVLTGLIARMFMQSELDKEDSDLRELTTEIRLLREKVEALERQAATEKSHLESIET